MDPIPTIFIAGYDQAAELLEGDITPRKFSHVVSINDPEKDPPRALNRHRGKHLVMHFHDAVVSRPRLVLPAREHVRGLLRFVRPLDDRHEILVHCAAGVSRSSAAVLTIIASKLEPSPSHALEAVRRLLAIKKTVYPNELFVELADEELGYRGSLLSAFVSAFKTFKGLVPD